jgi:N-acetyl-gamma-glutamyl-phosphate reductase
MGLKRYSAAIIGATGYAGAEAIRLLQGHPQIEVTVATSERAAGEALRAHCPWLDADLILRAPDLATIQADVFFLCQEAGYALTHAPALAKRAKVVDLSADFRLKDPAEYTHTYGREHPGFEHPWTYGMPEVTGREAIRAAQLVANPGCFPTATLIALMPLVRAGIVQGVPIVDAKTGVSGAGRAKRETDHLLAELLDATKAYGLPRHRHEPEMEQLCGPVRFVPHLLPMSRGILATIHLDVAGPVRPVWEEAYAAEPFVRIVDAPPSTKQVRGTNRCDLFVSQTDSHATVIAVIDNLVKGAAGQAIQNANLMLGLPEAMGLPTHGVWP